LSETGSSHERTEVLYGNDTIQGRVLEAFSRIKEELDGCIDHDEVAMNVKYDAIWNFHLQLNRKGVRLRMVTEITPENISYVKKIMEHSEVRHLAGVRSNFGIIDRKECLLHSISHEDEPLSHAIITNSKALVEAQYFLFETLWNKAIPAQEKITEIEEGMKPPFIETLRDPYEIQKLGLDLVNSAKGELFLLFSTANSFRHQQEIGFIQLLKEVASQKDIKIRILTHVDDCTRAIIDGLLKSHTNIHVRPLPQTLQTRLTTLIADRKYSLEVELKDDTKDNLHGAIGLATYSNIESTVWTHTSIFETLWMQAEIEENKKLDSKLSNGSYQK
jgi:two-component system, OmpR family, sensor histidine kinase VicK